MSVAFGLALYFMIWWVVLFAVLPFGVRTQGEAGEVTPGTPASAPASPQMFRLFAINTLLAGVVFGIVWYGMQSDWLVPASVPVPPPGVTPN